MPLCRIVTKVEVIFLRHRCLIIVFQLGRVEELAPEELPCFVSNPRATEECIA